MKDTRPKTRSGKPMRLKRARREGLIPPNGKKQGINRATARTMARNGVPREKIKRYAGSRQAASAAAQIFDEETWTPSVEQRRFVARRKGIGHKLAMICELFEIKFKQPLTVGVLKRKFARELELGIAVEISEAGDMLFDEHLTKKKSFAAIKLILERKGGWNEKIENPAGALQPPIVNVSFPSGGPQNATSGNDDGAAGASAGSGDTVAESESGDRLETASDSEE